ncbi:NAD(P)H-binding protein [Halomicrobium salinisoli]|uniref:NAD(P)H-binding protein n=1 Tax=Halomicrobium salinisoli TaxID=2878391 RepID=UPI001CF07F0B|nr:NAD(P)H-binding protein [Halomicrobium salinisoli]
MRVLVTGAAGFVGSHLVPVLVERGHEVHALVRDAEGYEVPPGVTACDGDLLDRGSFEGALAGVDAAYYLVHSMRAGDDFEAKDRRAARNFATAASEAGLDRVVYLGGLGDENGDLSAHLRSRREIESLLADGEYALTTLRAAIVIGPGSAGFEMIRQLAGRLPVMVTPRWIHTDCHPIAIGDVVAYLAGALEVPATAGETYEVGGPEVLSYAEIVRRTAAAMGQRPPRVISVPVLTPRLSSYWVEFVTDVPASVVRPLILGLKNPVVADDGPIREHLPVALTPFDEAVGRALAGRSPSNASERLDAALAAADSGADSESGAQSGGEA